MKWRQKNPKQGSIIRVWTGLYYHFGIYITDMQVVQFGLPGDATKKIASEVAVISTDIDTFRNGEFVEVAYYSLLERLRKRSDKKIVAYALSKLGNKSDYDFTTNNCEHFVNECVFGIGFALCNIQNKNNMEEINE